MLVGQAGEGGGVYRVKGKCTEHKASAPSIRRVEVNVGRTNPRLNDL